MVGKNNKFIKQNKIRALFLGRLSITREYTLIPRTITHIMVYAINVDIKMDIDSHPSQYLRDFSHPVDRTNSHTINNSMGMGDIHIAACSGKVNWVRDMVSRKKELLWCEDPKGNIPLHLALENGHKEVARYLIKEFPQGSYALNQLEESPLYLGVDKGDKGLVEFMLENLATDKEATQSLRKGKSILFRAIAANSQEMVQVILNRQPKLIKEKNNQGWSPLSCATYNGLTGIIGLFLEMFPDLVHKDLSYPIHKACIRGHVHILKMFHAHCPKYFTNPDQNGQTILHHAAKEPNNKLKGVVSYLLSLQESRKLIKMKDQTNRTPLELARCSRNREVEEIFRQKAQNMSP